MARPSYQETDPIDREASAIAGEEHVDPATGRLIGVWAIVLIPLLYGVYNTILKASALF
ncbi:MFS transporter small subunit [Rhodovibrio salinarum]|uniref:MFS transporter small subunit n=1 Tax=Rhodovibrio salinarum TaxID=1087 RepID=UPI0004B35651|nr:hypothetical protein [Rhodovibrio salinarum]